MKAILSVYEKTGLADFARALHQAGVELISTGGTARALGEAGLLVRQVSDLTGFPEILGGRVKSLHPAIHGGILARRDRPQHMEELKRLGLAPIDLVVVNLYPFEATIQKRGVTLDEALENIDIGGPAMVRAAAKNFPFVTVLVDPSDYGWVAERLKSTSPLTLRQAQDERGPDFGLTLEERRLLAAKAFQHVALYDAIVARYLRGEQADFPSELTVGYRKLYDLRYGENPHQKGALYGATPPAGGLALARQLHGKELSFNNILDADAAWRVVEDFSEPTVAVIKHNNPCGLACHPDLAEAYRRAYEGDPVSAYGGIVAFNRPVTAQAAEAMRKVFYEVVVAPGYENEALETLRRRKDLRVLEIGDTLIEEGSLDLRQVSGGLLVQTSDVLPEDAATWKAVTERQPTPEEMADLSFAWKAAKHVRSNAIVLAQDRVLVGMGTGQPNRVTSVHLALRVAGERSKGSVLASDAFFPFADGLEMAAQGGVTAVVQPGGSIRDPEVIAAANRYKVAMVFTSVRHFRH
ncbi:MAG: bifunctional phosphoribosylaminoimidazolecarboxamide formyltransferase/IMP cyclohydrolase [Chloroflexi bacterium]|nr:bifunctional phosphoribosylaminoimidazolecarboxamide formyltransferase/IMP cyclohydrolase [Chloroflexota bacterium]